MRGCAASEACQAEQQGGDKGVTNDILKNGIDSTWCYTGLAAGSAAPLDALSAGRCPHIASGNPWAIDVIVEFDRARSTSAPERAYLAKQ